LESQLLQAQATINEQVEDLKALQDEHEHLLSRLVHQDAVVKQLVNEQREARSQLSLPDDAHLHGEYRDWLARLNERNVELEEAHQDMLEEIQNVLFHMFVVDLLFPLIFACLIVLRLFVRSSIVKVKR
jgi:hypothetical protein